MEVTKAIGTMAKISIKLLILRSTDLFCRTNLITQPLIFLCSWRSLSPAGGAAAVVAAVSFSLLPAGFSPFPPARERKREGRGRKRVRDGDVARSAISRSSKCAKNDQQNDSPLGTTSPFSFLVREVGISLSLPSGMLKRMQGVSTPE